MPADLNERERRLMASFMALHAALCHALAMLPQDAIEDLRYRLLREGLEGISVLRESGSGGALRNELGQAFALLTDWLASGAPPNELWIAPLD